jgi:hypothetical protein
LQEELSRLETAGAEREAQVLSLVGSAELAVERHAEAFALSQRTATELSRLRKKESQVAQELESLNQKLDGQAVLDYCRARKGITSGTDIDRIDRQQRLLLSVFSQLKNSMRLSSIPDIYNKVKSGVYTNLNFEQITALTLFALDLDIDTECSRYTLKGEYTTANDHRYYVLDHRYTQKIIREIFGVEPVIDWSYSLEYVKNENARRALKSVVDTLSSFASKHKADLTGAQRDAVEAAIARAKKALKNGGISEMERTADDLTDLYGELSRYVKSLPHSPPPASSEPNAPSPEPAETPSEEPSGPSPEEPVADTQ